MRMTTDHSMSNYGIPIFVGDNNKTLDYADGLRKLRKTKGWSVADLAGQVGVSARTVEGWEQGRMPSKPALIIIMNLCNEFSFPTFQDFLDQLDASGVEIIGRAAFIEVVQAATHWPDAVISLVQQGRKQGIQLHLNAEDKPSNEQLYRLLSGYDFTEEQRRSFVRCVQHKDTKGD